MTRVQKMFNRVVKHVRKQGIPALNSDNDCMYRIGALKCAAGCLIPDNLYSPKMEQSSIKYVIDAFPNLKLYFKRTYGTNKRTLNVLKDLQTAHDYHLQYKGMNEFNDQIVIIATKYNLTVPTS